MDTSVVLFIAGVIISIIGWFTNRKMTDLENADKSHTAQISAQNLIIASLKEEKSALELRIASIFKIIGISSLLFLSDGVCSIKISHFYPLHRIEQRVPAAAHCYRIVDSRSSYHR